MRVPWTADGRNGGPTSMDVLVRWITTPGNYARWLGKGELVTDLVAEIAVALETQGITHRSAGGINRKLYDIIGQYNKANAWLRSIGVQDFNSDELVEREVLRICSFYRELAAVTRSTRPITPRRWQKLLQYELQLKRDEAVIVMAKARKELLETSIGSYIPCGDYFIVEDG